MDSYPSSPFSDPLDPLLFTSDSSSPSPYSSSSSSAASSYPPPDHAPSPFESSFPPSFDTPLPQPTTAPHSSWNGMNWPAQPVHEQPTTNAQQHATYYNDHTDHHMQQQQQHHHHQQQPYYPSAVPYTATVAQPPYPSALQHPAPTAVYSVSTAAYNHNSHPQPYVADHSNLIPHAVPALILPTNTDTHHPTTTTTSHYPHPVPAEPTTPPPPPLKFGDVFKGASSDMLFRHSQPVRALNHAQMRVWQQFEGGDNVRSISDAMGLKPHVVLHYIIYALESYSPAPTHPVFIHWPRFSIPPELMERVSAAMVRVGGALGRMDVVKSGLAGGGGGVLDEDVRIAMVRWKMERAVGAAFQPYDVYKVISASEAKERLERQRKEDLGEEEVKEGKVAVKAVVEETKEASGGAAAAAQTAETDTLMHDDATESKQPPTPTPATQPPPANKHQHKSKDKDKDKENKEQDKELDTAGFSGHVAAEPPYPPALTASEMLFQLSLGGGTSQRCLVGRFQRDWREIEAVLNKLIAEQLAWKRGLLYCPS